MMKVWMDVMIEKMVSTLMVTSKAMGTCLGDDEVKVVLLVMMHDIDEWSNARNELSVSSKAHSLLKFRRNFRLSRIDILNPSQACGPYGGIEAISPLRQPAPLSAR